MLSLKSSLYLCTTS